MSGSGKTTLLRLRNRLEVPDTGRGRFHGDDIADLDPLRLRRRVGMVFQQSTPLDGTVRANLHVAAPAADDHRCAAALASAVLGPDFLDRAADRHSSGDSGRVALARTLVAIVGAALPHPGLSRPHRT